jgi:hypothetical protein
MLTFVRFLPALTALLLALVAVARHTPAVRALGMALVMVSVWLARDAQRRAPSPRHGLTMPMAAAIIGEVAILTLMASVTTPAVSG